MRIYWSHYIWKMISFLYLLILYVWQYPSLGIWYHCPEESLTLLCYTLHFMHPSHLSEILLPPLGMILDSSVWDFLQALQMHTNNWIDTVDSRTYCRGHSWTLESYFELKKRTCWNSMNESTSVKYTPRERKIWRLVVAPPQQFDLLLEHNSTTLTPSIYFWLLTHDVLQLLQHDEFVLVLKWWFLTQKLKLNAILSSCCPVTLFHCTNFLHSTLCAF